MKSMCEILWLIADCEINTPEEAQAVFEEETREYMHVLRISEAEAIAQLQANLIKLAARATRSQAARILTLFNLHNPKGN